MGGNMNNRKPMRDKLMKQVQLEQPAPLLDHIYLGCTQRECKLNLKIVRENKDSFESLISPGTIKQLLGWKKSHVDIVAWSHDMEGYREEMRGEMLWLGKQDSWAFKPCLHIVFWWSSIPQGRIRNGWRFVDVCSQIVLTCFFRTSHRQAWHFHGLCFAWQETG